MITRFIQAQKKTYGQALNEIHNGKKQSHWIWYIFPQLRELGISETSKYYGIANIQEAQEYYQNDYLRKNLLTICNELLNIKGQTITEIVGMDDVKVHSCITLFLQVDKDNKTFKNIIDKYYNGILDYNTINILEKQKQS